MSIKAIIEEKIQEQKQKKQEALNIQLQLLEQSNTYCTILNISRQDLLELRDLDFITEEMVGESKIWVCAVVSITLWEPMLVVRYTKPRTSEKTTLSDTPLSKENFERFTEVLKLQNQKAE